jgi:hypothetical protein
MTSRRGCARRSRALIVLVAAITVSGCDSPLARELAPGAERFGSVASREIRLSNGSHQTLEVRARSLGKHIVLLRLAEESDWVLPLEEPGTRLRLSIEQESRLEQSVLIESLDRYSDRDGKAYVLRFLDVPRDLEVGRPGRIVLEVQALPRSVQSSSLTLRLEVRKISDL